MKVSDYIARFIKRYASHIFVGQGGNIIHVLDSCAKLKGLEVIPSQMNRALQLLLTLIQDLTIRLVLPQRLVDLE